MQLQLAEAEPQHPLLQDKVIMVPIQSLVVLQLLLVVVEALPVPALLVPLAAEEEVAVVAAQELQVKEITAVLEVVAMRVVVVVVLERLVQVVLDPAVEAAAQELHHHILVHQ